MPEPKQYLVCTTPQLCLIACPNNAHLAGALPPACAPALEPMEGEDEPVVVVFADGPRVPGAADNPEHLDS